MENDTHTHTHVKKKKKKNYAGDCVFVLEVVCVKF